eukprot:920308-Prymnesium_polylepis.1
MRIGDATNGSLLSTLLYARGWWWVPSHNKPNGSARKSQSRKQLTHPLGAGAAGRVGEEALSGS